MSHFVKTVLPKADADAYAKAKLTIQAHNASAKVWWGALVDIYNNQWYLTEFPTFQEWCAKHTEWTPGTIRMAISDMKKATAEELIKTTTKEAVIREPKKSRAHVSRPQVATCTFETTPSETKQNLSVADDMGKVIPESVHPVWKRRAEIAYLMGVAAGLKKAITDHLKDRDDMLFHKIPQDTLVKLESVCHDLEWAFPEVVCGECEGRLHELSKGLCKCCDNTGLMSKGQYNRYVAEEKRNMRKAELDEASRLSGTVSQQHPRTVAGK